MHFGSLNGSVNAGGLCSEVAIWKEFRQVLIIGKISDLKTMYLFQYWL